MLWHRFTCLGHYWLRHLFCTFWLWTEKRNPFSLCLKLKQKVNLNVLSHQSIVVTGLKGIKSESPWVSRVWCYFILHGVLSCSLKQTVWDECNILACGLRHLGSSPWSGKCLIIYAKGTASKGNTEGACWSGFVDSSSRVIGLLCMDILYSNYKGFLLLKFRSLKHL